MSQVSVPVPLLNTPDSFRAGNVARAVVEWENLTRDRWVLSMVQGVSIPLQWRVLQERVPYPYKLQVWEKQVLTSELVKLERKGVIESVTPEEGQFISNVFLRPKANGDFRLILDLTEFNKAVEYEHFKMTSLQTALDALRPGAWMASVDLKDAYYSVPVRVQDRKFLRFIWEGVLYQFVGLPNGLSCAPRVFTKILKPLFAKMAESGFECFPYIDDSFVIADSEEECRQAVEALCVNLDRLGFVIHDKKSVFQPTQDLVFLGFWIDSVTMTVALTEEKRAKFTRADLLDKDSVSVREVAGLVGLMTAYSPAVEYGGAHIKQLELEKNQALLAHKGNFEGSMTLSAQAKCDITWWLGHLQLERKVRLDPPERKLFTDASNEGMGAHMGDLRAGGRWSPEEKASHINVLELRAVLFGLQSLCQEESVHVQVFTDNTTALAYVKHMGGVKSVECNKVAKEIWEWCEVKNLWLTISHIPGVLNTLADFKSRNFVDNTEWQLNDKIWKKICKVFGTPSIDLFASRVNAKLARYVSWGPDPKACAVDAFSLTWNEEFYYIFPPFSLVARTLQKLFVDGGRAILVVPQWSAQPWFARLHRMTSRTIHFRKKEGNLYNLGQPTNKDVLNSCQLVACLL